jgi:hypothetical protein
MITPLHTLVIPVLVVSLTTASSAQAALTLTYEQSGNEQNFFAADEKSVTLKMALKSISRRSVPASTFELPSTAKPEGL